MRRITTLVILTMIITLFLTVAGHAAPPVQERQTVYGITPWTGKEYGGTFAHNDVDTIFLLADVDNVLSALRTDVYYWPITGDYRANWAEFREEVPGSLEVLQDGRRVHLIEAKPYVHVLTVGPRGTEAELAIGDDAHTWTERYRQGIDDYWDALAQFRIDEEAYQREMDEILREVTETGVTFAEEDLPQPPVQPQPPRLNVTRINQGFVVNLPEGTYTIRTIDPDGRTVPHTEKQLVIFRQRREGVGYQIIPESQWTRPVESGDPAEILYIEGQRTLYMKAVEAQEYNHHAYMRMLNAERPLAGLGGETAYTWAYGKEIPSARIQLVQDGTVVEEISEKPFFVRQTPGFALGYTIEEFDPNDPHLANRQPSFEAFRVEITPGSYQVRTVDANGRVVPGSVREIRAVNMVPTWQLIVLSVLPLLIGVVVFVRRRVLAKRPAKATA